MGRGFNVPDMAKRNRNDIPDLLRALFVKVSVTDERSSTKRL